MAVLDSSKTAICLSGTGVLTFNSKRFSYSQEFAVCIDGHLVVQQSLIHDEGI